MAIARVQSTSNNTGAPVNISSLALTFGSATTAGNTVIVGVCGGALAPIKVTSAHGIFYNASPGAIEATGATVETQIFYGIMTGADTVITIALLTGGNLNEVAAVAVEYSGALILPDGIPTPAATIATNAANTGNLTNSNANALYVGVIGIKTNSSTQNTNWAFNNVAPFSIVNSTMTNNNGGSNVDKGICYLDAVVNTSAGRIANINHSLGPNRYAGLIVTFDQAAAGGGGIRTAGHGGLAA
jgi:hypothetical protein